LARGTATVASYRATGSSPAQELPRAPGASGGLRRFAAVSTPARVTTALTFLAIYLGG